MYRPVVALAAVLFVLALLQAQESVAQWSANPGETIRNAFGPAKNKGYLSAAGPVVWIVRLPVKTRCNSSVSALAH